MICDDIVVASDRLRPRYGEVKITFEGCAYFDMQLERNSTYVDCGRCPRSCVHLGQCDALACCRRSHGERAECLVDSANAPCIYATLADDVQPLKMGIDGNLADSSKPFIRKLFETRSRCVSACTRLWIRSRICHLRRRFLEKSLLTTFGFVPLSLDAPRVAILLLDISLTTALLTLSSLSAIPLAYIPFVVTLPLTAPGQ